MNIKAWLWEMTPKDEDNVKHTNLNSKVDMIGVQEFIKPTKVKNEIKSKKTFKKKNFKCSFPFKQLVINNEKQVLPCCTFWGEELSLMHGGADEASFKSCSSEEFDDSLSFYDSDEEKEKKKSNT